MTWEEHYYAIAALHSVDTDFVTGRKSSRMIQFVNETNPRSLLEVGCGEAKLAERLPESVTYTGVDPSEYAIERARKAYRSRPSVRLEVGEADKLPYPDAIFDVVVAHYSLEHFAKPRESLREMVRVLTPGGSLILIAPNLELPLAYPSALRHKSGWHRVCMAALRTYDYFLRLLGIYTFRTLPENYLDATGRYERGDDDLRYLVSTYEVVGYLKRHGLTPTALDRLTSGKKRWLTYLPGLRYYGTELFGIFKKRI